MASLPRPPSRDQLLAQAAREHEELRNIIRHLNHDLENEPPVPVPPLPPLRVGAPPAIVQHLNVSCDECGELPIVGTRYKSRTQPNYDVCQGCLEENHSGSAADFDVLTRYRPSVATTAIRREANKVGRSVSIHSLYELESQLQDDSVEDVAFYVGTRLTCPQLGATVRRVLKQTKSLKSVHIHIFGTEFSTATIVAIAEGLQQNTSALSVSWNLLWNRHDPPLDARAANALKTLMETNTTMQYMFVHRQRGFGIAHPVVVTNPNTNNTAEDNDEEDPLADAIFEALAKTHLHTVRYSGTSPVQPHNQKKAWAAMIANPHLKRVKTLFASSTAAANTCDTSVDSTDAVAGVATNIDTTSSQEYLELLQTDKKHCWLQRWTGFAQQQQSSNDNACDTDDGDGSFVVTEQERQESQKRWKVLQEVLDTKDLDKKVPVIYHLLRNQPECLLQVQLPISIPPIMEDDEEVQDVGEDEDVYVSMVGNHHQLAQDMHMADDTVRPMDEQQEENGDEEDEEQFQLDLEEDDTYDNLNWV